MADPNWRDKMAGK
jgi:hypothetical protein